jgi:hypothetical protein
MGKSEKNIEMGVIGIAEAVRRRCGGDLVVMGVCLGGGTVGCLVGLREKRKGWGEVGFRRR